MTEQFPDHLIELNDRQQRPVGALLRGGTHEQAAIECGVHRVTITRWCGLPSFRAAMNRERQDREQQLAARARRVDDAALDALERGVTDGDPKVLAIWARMRGNDAWRADPIGPLTAEAVFEDLVAERVRDEEGRYLQQLVAADDDDIDVPPPPNHDEIRGRLIAELDAVADHPAPVDDAPTAEPRHEPDPAPMTQAQTDDDDRPVLRFPEPCHPDVRADRHIEQRDGSGGTPADPEGTPGVSATDEPAGAS